MYLLGEEGKREEIRIRLLKCRSSFESSRLRQLNSDDVTPQVQYVTRMDVLNTLTSTSLPSFHVASKRTRWRLFCGC